MKFGTTSLPHVLNFDQIVKRQLFERGVPGSEVAYRSDLGGMGERFVIEGEIRGSVATTIATLKALADGTERSLDFEDGSTAITCLAIDPYFSEDVKAPDRAKYRIEFVRTA